MQIVFMPEAKDDLAYWSKTGNKALLKKITQLIKDIQQNGYQGIGKPEPLKYHLSGCWARRIDQQHRLVYEITDDKILIYSARGHYK